MFKTAKELQKFIMWAKENHVKRIKIGDIDVEISDIAHIPELNPPKMSQVISKSKSKASKDAKSAPEAEETKELGIMDDPDLFHSVTN